MTKQEFVHLIIERLTGGRQVTSQLGIYHPNIIALSIERAMNQLFRDLFKNDPSQLDGYAKETSDLSVVFDTNAKRFYTELTSPLVQVQDDEGIRWVFDQRYPQHNFTKLPRGRQYRFHKMGIFNINNRVTWSLNSSFSRLYFDNIIRTEEVESGSIALGSYYLVNGYDSVTYDSTTYRDGDIFLGTAETDFTMVGSNGSVQLLNPPEDITVAQVIPFASLDDNDQVAVPTGQDQAVLEIIIRYIKETDERDRLNDSES